VLVERAVPDRASDDGELIRSLADEWLAEYARDPVARTRPYDGIEELVDRLGELGLVLGVLSNKPDELVRRSVAALFKASAFAVVWGKRDEMPAKPDPTSAAAIAAEIDVAPGEIVYLGDSDIDMETARNAGMIPVGAAWGFRGAEELRAAGAEHVISEPAELIDLVTKESEVWRQR
jgi:phosphoglycolate phosphatase